MIRPHRPTLAIINFSALVAALCLIPTSAAEHRQFPPTAVAILTAAAGTWSTWIVSGRRWGAVVGVLASTAVLRLEFASDAASPSAHVLPGFLLASAVAVAAMALCRAALSKRTHREDRIYHGLTSYLLIGIAFGMALQRVAIVYPGSFRMPGDPDGSGTWADYVWLSFSTLTTAGFSDVVPISSWARLTCTLEAVTGVLFPAVFLARLVTAASEDPDAQQSTAKESA